MSWWFPPPRHGGPVRKVLGRTRPTAIDRCTDGHSYRIAGVVEGVDALAAPITGRPCVFWSISIDEVGQGDYVERGFADQGASFLVRDDAGVARVVPDGARVDLPATSTTRLPPHGFEPNERALYTQLRVELNYPRTSSVRFNERVITNGARVTVLGLNQLEPAQQAADADVDLSGYRGDLPMRPVFSSSRRTPLLIGFEGS